MLFIQHACVCLLSCIFWEGINNVSDPLSKISYVIQLNFHMHMHVPCCGYENIIEDSCNFLSSLPRKQILVTHPAPADAEINFITSHNYNKILDSDWLRERPIFNQIQTLFI